MIKKIKKFKEIDFFNEREKIGRKFEKINESFRCANCKLFVSTMEHIGTKHRNHCPSCLYSKHVDLNKSGDRKASCQAKMKPIGLTLKHEGLDKYGNLRKGELMLIHECTSKNCDCISINRIAADDNPQSILGVFEKSLKIDQDLANRLEDVYIDLLDEEDRGEIDMQLFGRIS